MSGVNFPQMNKAIVIIKIANIKPIVSTICKYTVKLQAIATNYYDECHAFIDLRIFQF